MGTDEEQIVRRDSRRVVLRSAQIRVLPVPFRWDRPCPGKEKKENAYSDLGELGGDTGGDLADSESGQLLSQAAEGGGQIGDVSVSKLGGSVLLGVHLAL